MSVSKNIIANYVGQIVNSLLNIAFIPVYLKLLGTEAYGLVGFYASLQAVLSLLDLGMTPTLSREIALFRAGEREAITVRNLLKSFEAILYILLLLVIIIFTILANYLANVWFHVEKLQLYDLKIALVLMAGVCALRLIEALYRGCLIGLQEQVRLNVLSIMFSITRYGGAVIALYYINSTIICYFIWQILCSIIIVLVLKYIIILQIPVPPPGPRISGKLINNIFRFALGVSGTAILGIMLNQFEKMTLSKFLYLNDYAYYTISVNIASALYMFVTPVATALGPRLTALVAAKDTENIRKEYHQSAQLVAVMIGSAASVLIVFRHELLTLWSSDALLAAKAQGPLFFLSIGVLANGVLWIPYQLQLAYGWSSLSFYINCFLCLIYIPIQYFVAKTCTATVVAATWAGMNVVCLVLTISILHTKYLTSEKRSWCIQDTLIPLISALSISVIVKYMAFKTFFMDHSLFQILFAACCSVIVSSFLSTEIRNRIFQIYKSSVQLR